MPETKTAALLIDNTPWKRAPVVSSAMTSAKQATW